MIKENLILIEGGGHCKSCIDVIEQEGRFEIKGIVVDAGAVVTKHLETRGVYLGVLAKKID